MPELVRRSARCLLVVAVLVVAMGPARADELGKRLDEVLVPAPVEPWDSWFLGLGPLVSLCGSDLGLGLTARVSYALPHWRFDARGSIAGNLGSKPGDGGKVFSSAYDVSEVGAAASYLFGDRDRTVAFVGLGLAWDRGRFGEGEEAHLSAPGADVSVGVELARSAGFRLLVDLRAVFPFLAAEKGQWLTDVNHYGTATEWRWWGAMGVTALFGVW